MSIIRDVVRGVLKVDNLPERACFTSWQDFLEELPTFLTVELPTNVSGVVVGRDFPTDDDKDKVWFRRDPSGNFLGIYAFQNGAWRPFYNVTPGQVIWTIGDSDNVPDGFVLIETGDATIPSTVVEALMGQYISKAGGGGGFVYFAMRFAGY